MTRKCAHPQKPQATSSILNNTLFLDISRAFNVFPESIVNVTQLTYLYFDNDDLTEIIPPSCLACGLDVTNTFDAWQQRFDWQASINTSFNCHSRDLH